MDDDDLPSFDYLKRFRQPKVVRNETIGDTSVRKPWEEVKSSVAGTSHKETESFKQVPNKRKKKQSREANAMPSTSGVKRKITRKAKSKTNTTGNTAQKKTRLEPDVIDSTSGKFISTLTGVNPETVDYTNLTQNQLQHLIRKLNNFYAHNAKRNKVKKGNRRNLFPKMRSNASVTFGKGQVGKSNDSFWDCATSWQNYNSRLDYLSMYRRQKQMEKELEDEALNTLLLQIDIPKNQKPEINTAVVDSIDLTYYNEPKTVDLTNAFNNSVICLEDSDVENNEADVKNSNNMDDSVQIIQNNTNIEEVLSISIEDSSKTDISLSEPSISNRDTSIQDLNATGESSSAGTTLNTTSDSTSAGSILNTNGESSSAGTTLNTTSDSTSAGSILNTNGESSSAGTTLNTTSESSSAGSTLVNRATLLECPICFEDMMTKQRGATKCGHVFCLDCIQKSLQCSSKCPTCRKTVRKNSVIPLFY